MDGKIRLLIVDDHAMVREGLEAMLSVDTRFESILTASSREETMEILARASPHLVLLDLRMPGFDGFNVLETVLGRWPSMRVLILSAGATGPEVRLARSKGARGYICKSAGRAALLEAIDTVIDGRTFFEDGAAREEDDLTLSARELEVLRHLGRSLSADELGVVFGISKHTVKSHLKAIFMKLGVAGQAEAVTRGYEMGLITVEKDR
ncbi:response regulator transcription factor [Luteolibacter yonseiensis]